MEEVYVSLECTAKLYFRGPQRPVEHRCRLTLGASGHQNRGSSTCILTIEGDACQRRSFKVIKENISNVVARLGDGSMTVVFKNSCCDCLVVKEVVNRAALTLCHKLICGIWMGVGENFSQGGGKKFATAPGGAVTPAAGDESGGGQSVSRSTSSGKKKLQLNLGKRYGETRGGRMVEAAQSKPATASSFYKVDSSVVASSEPFLPQTPPTSSPYFHQKAARRNLTLELSDDRGLQRERGKNVTPEDFSLGGREHSLGPRKAAVLARKRLPLGDIFEQPRSSTLKDYLTLTEPSNREGFANLGNTCYMNAVLQVLLGLEPFAEDLLNHQLMKKVHPHSLCRMMYLLLKSKRSKDSYESQKILLKKIKSVIESSRPKFSGYRQQDAHELLTQCLDQLKDDSKHIKLPASEELSELSMCPVIQNFECEMCRSITCKRCGKVTEVNEQIYDFALQLPKNVLLKANEQANLQDLLDAFFVSEEVEYKCSTCACNSVTMSCQLARLPRVMILFLKRYGYNANLSRNSKRIDFIRIPRFIRVGHLCSEKVEPPFEYRGPWPKDAGTPTARAENKENFPSSRGAERHFPSEPNPPGCVPPFVSGESAILGKRGSGEMLDVAQETTQSGCDVVKKQKIEHVSSSNSDCRHMSSDTTKMDCSGALVVGSGTSVVNSGARSADNCSTSATTSCSTTVSFGSFVAPPLTNSSTMVSSSCNTSGNGTTGCGGRGMVNNTTRDGGQSGATSDLKCRQNSVGRDIAAEFDSLFSPEVIFEFDNNSSFTSTSPTMATAATTTNTVDTATTSTKCSTTTTDSVPVTTCAVMPLSTRGKTAGDSSTSCASMQTEHPLPPSADSKTPNKGTFSPGLFGGVSCSSSTSTTRVTAPGRGTPADTTQQQSGTVEMSEWCGETEDEEGLKRAMEESMKDQQSSDVVLLQQMGLSEEDQLKLALELSMQEHSPAEECPTEPSSECAAELTRAETPTPDTCRPETYKLMGIVNHVGKASSGGHYVSDVCSASDGVWHCYNDCHVNEAREEDIRQRRQGTGYIFFYMHKSILGSIGCSDKRTT